MNGLKITIRSKHKAKTEFTPSNFSRIVLDEIIDDVANQIETSVANISNKLLANIIAVIVSEMKHTTRHGWNYNYTKSLATSFSMTDVEKSVKKTEDGFDIHVKQSVVSNHPAAAILEFGGTIRSKGRRLRVPAKGTPWPINRQVETDFTRGIIQYRKIGGLTIPAYVLKHVVHIPAYAYISKAIARLKNEE